MSNHIELGGNARPANCKFSALTVQQHLDNLQFHRDAIAKMLTGDSADDASYGDVATIYMLGSNAAAHHFFSELDAAMNNSAALRQFLAEVGP